MQATPRFKTDVDLRMAHHQAQRIRCPCDVRVQGIVCHVRLTTSSTGVEMYSAGNATMTILGLSYVVEEMGMIVPFPDCLITDSY